jgi:hypothetical protein
MRITTQRTHQLDCAKNSDSATQSTSEAVSSSVITPLHAVNARTTNASSVMMQSAQYRHA